MSTSRRTNGRRRLWIAAGLTAALAMVAAACSDTPSPMTATAPASPEQLVADGPDLAEDLPPAGFEVRGSVNQVSLTGAEEGDELTLFAADRSPVAAGTADAQGSYLFREVAAGDGYRVATSGSDAAVSEAVAVLDEDESLPSQDFYSDQALDEGFEYITTRDGTTLSASVYLPGPVEDGPYPTVVEYSGYSPSKPGTNLLADRFDEIKGSLPGDLTLEQVCSIAPFACNAPDQPASIMAHALGYAVVGVNMRGTGCSGGAYDFFEPLQLLDGYDIVETVAAQPWVKDNQVGMVGLSYPGIAQLFVASTQPPSLSAITPLSVYDDTARGVLAPGGIFNEGFALTWADEVLSNAEPYGQGWERDVVDEGDETCAENQLLRGQNVDAVSKAKQYPYYEPSVADPLNPSLFVDQIDVPVFLTGAFQDEQTGGRFPLLFNSFTNSPVTRFSAWNGAHADGFQPMNIVEWKTFLDFYVAGELTDRSLAADLFLPLVGQEVFGKETSLPPQRMFEDQATFEAKKAAYEAEDPIRILFESGAGDPDEPGMPNPTLDRRFASWPLPGTAATSWYLQPGGALGAEPPTADSDSASTFEVTPSLATTRTFDPDSGGDLFRYDVTYDWLHEPDGAATVFVSEPLDADIVMVGSASADLWVRSDTGEADLGVTLSEVRPDGKETYVQSGVLRGTQRATTDASTELLPRHSNLEKDAAAMPEGEFTEARVEIFPFAQIFRKGSRIRISVHTPGGDKARWSYILAPEPEGATIDIAHSAEYPSKVVLPVVDGITGYPTALPPCPGLRAQPCREFEEYSNTDS